MLTDKERTAIAEWHCLSWTHLEEWLTQWGSSIDVDPRAYMPLFERLAREQGYALWSQKDGPSLWWFCGAYTDVPHRTRQEPSPGTAVCRAVLALRKASTLDKKAKP